MLSHARTAGNRIGARTQPVNDLYGVERSLLPPRQRVARPGLAKGDRFAAFAYNAAEWLEIYAAASKAGLIVVPINFRLLGPGVRYVV